MSRAKDRLRGKGIAANEVSASRMILVPHTSLWLPPPEHPLHDPRSLDPVDVEMAADMAARHKAGKQPNTDALLVWEQESKRLLVGDGNGRTLALRSAAFTLGKGTVLMVLVELYDGDEKGFLLERARRNDPNRVRADSIDTLAFRVRQLTAVGATEREIADACPRSIGPAEVAALQRFESLTAAAKALFRGGAPIGLLAAVLDGDRATQAERLTALQAKGLKSTRAATRHTNGARDKADPWARRMSPRALRRVSETLATAAAPGSGSLEGGKAVREAAFHVAMGLQIAAGRDVVGALDLLPKPVADAIREARTGKVRR